MRFEKLRDLGNTLLVVEHDREVVAAADQLLDFGPAAGDGGGEIVASGTPAKVARERQSVTGPFLSGKKAIAVPSNRRMPGRQEQANAAGNGSSSKKSGRKASAKSHSQQATPSGARPIAPGGWLEIVVRGTTICATSTCKFRWAR